MKNIRKRDKGITLIVLVITIIILLILAGITISSLTESGLFLKAKESKVVHIKAEMKEQLQIAISDLQIEKMGNATLNDINEEWLDKQLNDYEKKLEEDTETGGKIITIKKNDSIGRFLIDEELNVIELETTGIMLSYKATSVDESNANIVISVIAIEDKIETIEIDGAQIENVKGKESINIDYTVQLSKEYTIKVISEKGIEKQDIINIKIPKTPIIPDITLSYPVVALNQVKAPIAEIEIEYDNSEGIFNYYSLDNGTTWEKYTGRITVQSGTERVKAKSEYKKCKGIYSESEKETKVEEKDDTLKPNAYDKNLETGETYNNAKYPIPNLTSETNGHTSVRFFVDETTWGERLKINYKVNYSLGYYRAMKCAFLGKDNEIIKTDSYDTLTTGEIHEIDEMWIPENTRTIILYCADLEFIIYELKVTDEAILKIGSYVIYDVTYTDMGITKIEYDNSEYGKCGWRILDIGEYDENSKTYTGTKLISTGIPMNLKYYSTTPNDWWGTEGYKEDKVVYGLKENFAQIPFEKIESGESEIGKGYYYNTITNKNPSSQYNTNTGAILLTNKAIKVSNVTLEEMNKARYGDEYNESKANDRTSFATTNGLFDLRKTFNGETSQYWIATKSEGLGNNEGFLNTIDGLASIGSRNWYNIGVRPVITLKSGIKIKKEKMGMFSIE